MDFRATTTGERLAGASGLLLFIFMFIDWYGVKGLPGGASAWQAFSFIDIVLLVTAICAVGLLLLSASDADIGLPVAASAIVAGLGVLAVVLVVFRIIDTPGGGDFSNGLVTVSVDVTRKIGVWLGLLTSVGVAVGGYLAMQEEGTSFGDEASRFGGGGDAGTGAPPPPPPTSSAPPPSSPPPSNP
jgi:hypothetical protein